MAEKLDASLPLGYVVGPGWTVRVTAVSPADGSLVANVKVSNVVINGAGTTVAEPPGAVPPLLVNEGPPS